MDAFNVKSNSWHYRLACLNNFNEYDRRHLNLCVYIRKVIFGGFEFVCNILFMLVIVYIVLGAVVDFLAWLIASAWVGYPIVGLTNLGIAGAILLIVSITIVSYLLLKDLIISLITHLSNLLTKVYKAYQVRKTRKITTATAAKSEPSFMKVLYQNFKDKTCIKITVE